MPPKDDGSTNRTIRIPDGQWEEIQAEAQEWKQNASSFVRDAAWAYTILLRISRLRSLANAAEVVFGAVRSDQGERMLALVDEQLELLAAKRDSKGGVSAAQYEGFVTKVEQYTEALAEAKRAQANADRALAEVHKELEPPD